MQTRTVLIVEDSDVVWRLLKHLLEREGYEPHVVEDGLSAQAYLKSGQIPAAVFLDVMLPHVDGIQLLKQIRSQPGWQKVPVIMLSARRDELTTIAAFEAGADDYVKKPFRPGELVARLRRLVPQPS